MQDVPICNVAVAYDDPDTGETYVQFFNQVLVIDDLDCHLYSEFQLESYGLRINKTPLIHMHPNARTPSQHSIISDDPETVIPLPPKGIVRGG